MNHRNKLKFISAFIILIAPVLFGQVVVGSSINNLAMADSIAPDHSGMSDSGSVGFTKAMVPGWNLGNTLEALPSETSWGNPLTTQKFIDSVKAAGFNSIRIPVAWSKFTDTATYIIDTIWLKRVEQVIKYVLNDSMYAIINEHWDGGWQQPTFADSAYVNHRLAAMWKQIAIHFRDYNDHLLFAGTNEIGVANYYGTPKNENYIVQNGFNQIFVNTVRSTGGRNYYRFLVVQGYVTNIDYTVSNFLAPADVAPSRLLVEVHYYDPYDFTLNSNDKIIQWGKYATDPTKTETWANESWADAEFNKMKVNFVDKGFGVIIGEYGATIRTSLGSASLNAQYEAYRRYYMQYITRSIERNQLVPYYWDVGVYGNHGSGILDRNTGAHVYTDILNAIIDTSIVDPVLGINQSPSVPSKFYLNQNYPNPFNPGTVISWQLAEGSQVSIKLYNVLGKEVAGLFNGFQNEGLHSINFFAQGLASGIYFYKLKAVPINGSGGSFIETKKMILIK